MKIAIYTALSLLIPSAAAFAPHSNTNAFSRTSSSSSVLILEASTTSSHDADSSISSSSRRDILFKATSATVSAAAALTFLPSLAMADGEETAAAADAASSSTSSTSIQNIVVAGATGQTGSRIYNKLRSQSNIYTTTGGVRNVAKATKAGLGSNSNSNSNSNSDTLKHLDVVEDSLESLTAMLKDTKADGLVIACGMNPGKNLLRMNAAAHEVDNLGTIKLIDAAKQAGVKKVVLVSSILTNGRAWGQEDSPGFKITNAFGNALDEKLAAEKYLRTSGLDYTIVRPGGLQNKAPVGGLSINKEDTLNSGEISRDLVADVCIASLNDVKATNTVLEIIEDEGKPPKVFNGLVM